MNSGAVEAVLVPALKVIFLLLLAGGVAGVVRELALLARGRRAPGEAGEKGKH